MACPQGYFMKPCPLIASPATKGTTGRKKEDLHISADQLPDAELRAVSGLLLGMEAESIWL